MFKLLGICASAFVLLAQTCSGGALREVSASLLTPRRGLQEGTDNTCPVAPDYSLTVTEDMAETLVPLKPPFYTQLDPRDDDGDLVTVASFTKPKNGRVSKRVNPNNVEFFVYRPKADFFGPDMFTYTVTDGICEVTGTVVVDVTPVNDCPRARNDRFVAFEERPRDFFLLQDDIDPDSDLRIVEVTEAFDATVVISEDGQSVNFAPDVDFFGEVPFNYTVTDGICNDTAQVWVSVWNVNDCPVAFEDSEVTDEGVPVVIDVLANDVDVDIGDSLTIVEITSLPRSGDATISTDKKQITYAPGPGFAFDDVFQYSITDGNSNCIATAAVRISVLPNNTCPEALNDFVWTDQATSVTIPVLANDTDVDIEDELTVVDITSAPIGGSTVISEDKKTITYVPDSDFFGSDSFQYSMTDGNDGCETIATVFVEVLPVIVCPVEDLVSLTAVKDSPAEIKWNGNPKFAVEDTPSNATGAAGSTGVSIESLPMNGSISISVSKRITYTPKPRFTGTDSFQYSLLANNGACVKLVWVNVVVNNDPHQLI